jgi:hypothetical protein
MGGSHLWLSPCCIYIYVLLSVNFYGVVLIRSWYFLLWRNTKVAVAPDSHRQIRPVLCRLFTLEVRYLRRRLHTGSCISVSIIYPCDNTSRHGGLWKAMLYNIPLCSDETNELDNSWTSSHTTHLFKAFLVLSQFLRLCLPTERILTHVQGIEENIWNEERWSDSRMEKTA